MKRLWLWAVIGAVLVPFAGCDSRPSTRDLGELVYEMPRLENAAPAAENAKVAPAPEKPAPDSASDAPAAPQK